MLPDGLLLDERAPARADAAIGELAALLHSHLIGELTIHPGGDVEAWRNFLLLLGRTPESVRAEGGIARVWTTMAGRHVELREIDYAEVLRERAGGEPAVWEQRHRQLPAGQLVRARRRRRSASCSSIAGDSEQLAELMATLEAQRGERRRHRRQDRRADAHAARHRRCGVEERAGRARAGAAATWRRAVGQLSPEMLLGLLCQQGGDDDGPAADAAPSSAGCRTRTIAQLRRRAT